MNVAANESGSATFTLTDRVPIFSYLISPNRVRWYRVIMRTFFQRHRELYRYQLTAQEVRDAVRESLDPDYTLEQCQNDLAALKEWGNLTTIYDSSRATSISSFLSPALLYQATPEAIAIETFLAEQVRASSASGSLRQGDLARLWQALDTIDKTLQESSSMPLSPTQSRELAEEWQRAFEVWNTMAREAAQYLATMMSAAQQTQPELEAYQAYKAAVVAYVHGFAQALTQYGPRIRELLADWSLTGRREQFIALVAAYLDPPDPTLALLRTDEEREQDVLKQLEALAHWFAYGSNADSFRRSALAEVDKVVRRAVAFASAARPNANYANHLNVLAHQLFEARDGEVAQQLFSVAFANVLPLHLPEGLAGSPSQLREQEPLNAWTEQPDVTLHLRPVSRANRSEPTQEDPIADNRLQIARAVAQHEQKMQEQRTRFERLFARKFLDLGALGVISAEDRTILLQVIDQCLGQPSHQYRSPTGSLLTLLNPAETQYTLLRAKDGVMLLPRYRLQEGAVEAGAREDAVPSLSEG